MPTLRTYAVGAATPAALPKLRVFGVVGVGAGPSSPKLRLFGVTGVGTTAPVLSPIASTTVEPMTVTTVTAVPASGSSTPDTYVWRVVSGGPVSLTTAGAVATLTTPATPPPNPLDVVLGVKGLNAGNPSAEVFATVTVPPQLAWYWDGTKWVGSKQNILT